MDKGMWDHLVDMGLTNGFLTYQDIFTNLPLKVTAQDMEQLLDELDKYEIDVFDGRDLKRKY
jgi:hypothetical protein